VLCCRLLGGVGGCASVGSTEKSDLPPQMSHPVCNPVVWLGDLPCPCNQKYTAIMTPTSKQVDEISEVLALLMEDFGEEILQETEVVAAVEEESLSEEALARVFAKSLAAKGGNGNLRNLLGAARGLLRVSLEVV
jgi:hypothetical protein